MKAWRRVKRKKKKKAGKTRNQFNKFRVKCAYFGQFS